MPYLNRLRSGTLLYLRLMVVASCLFPHNEKFPWESSSHGNFAIKINKAMSFDFGLGPQSLHSHYCPE